MSLALARPSSPLHLPPRVRHADAKPVTFSVSYFFMRVWDLVGVRGRLVTETDEAEFGKNEPFNHHLNGG